MTVDAHRDPCEARIATTSYLLGDVRARVALLDAAPTSRSREQAQNGQHQRVGRGFWDRRGSRNQLDRTTGGVFQVVGVGAGKHATEVVAKGTRYRARRAEIADKRKVAEQQVIAAVEEERRAAVVPATDVGFLVVGKDRRADGEQVAEAVLAIPIEIRYQTSWGPALKWVSSLRSKRSMMF